MCAAAFAPGATAQGGRVGLAPVQMISPAAPRAAINPGVMPGINRGVMPNVRRGILPNVNPGIYPGLNRGGLPAAGLRRPGRFGGGSALGLAGLGLSLADDFPAPGGDGFDPDFAPPFPPPAVIPAVAPPPPCVRPLIISIGSGLRRPAKARVVYGRQWHCR